MWVEGYPCRRDGLRHCLRSDRKSIETSDIYLREREMEGPFVCGSRELFRTGKSHSKTRARVKNSVRYNIDDGGG